MNDSFSQFSPFFLRIASLFLNKREKTQKEIWSLVKNGLPYRKGAYIWLLGESDQKTLIIILFCRFEFT
jgi:hypothetical protein